jgi:hypothetical protein
MAVSGAEPALVCPLMCFEKVSYIFECALRAHRSKRKLDLEFGKIDAQTKKLGHCCVNGANASVT